MIKRGNENFIAKILYNQKFLALVGLGLIVLISFPLAKNVSKRYRLDQEIKEMNKEISDFESENKDLKQLITYLESDQFVEEKARLNLGLKKEGESMAVVKDDVSISPELRPKAGAEVSRHSSNPYRWWNYFFNKPRAF